MSTLPEPPWRSRSRAQVAPRVPITRDAILDAAARALEQTGMDGLSMRRVADELGTGPASLYWHVRNKDELLQLLFERFNDEIELPQPDPSTWQEQLKLLGRQVRAVAHRHRDYARTLAGPHPVRSDHWRALLNGCSSCLSPVGVPDQVIAYCGDLISLYVGAYRVRGKPWSAVADGRTTIGRADRQHVPRLPAVAARRTVPVRASRRAACFSVATQTNASSLAWTCSSEGSKAM